METECIEASPPERKEVGEPYRPRAYKDILESSTGSFVDCLLPTRNLLEHLAASSVLNPDMVLKVSCRPNRPDKVRVLLKFLMTLGPDAFISFIEALRATDQHSLANILVTGQ